MSRFVFRVDASLQIGTGHLFRCLALAEGLRAKGSECHFICRQHAGNFAEMVRREGFELTVLRSEAADFRPQVEADLSSHAAWLGADWRTDAEQTRASLEALKPAWLVVDHYALDARWELALQPHYGRLLVIDDLADRPHACDVLLDQTFGRSARDYEPLVPASCVRLTGSAYALLRPQFAASRAYSLERRKKPQLEHLLITMGGVDTHNATGKVLEAVALSALPGHCRITVVMGAAAPWLESVRQQCSPLRWQSAVAVDVREMAQLIADSDLSIGAAGATSWERCCLGLPSIIIVTAPNQQLVARAIENAGAACFLGEQGQIETHLPGALNALIRDSRLRADMSHAASRIADGRGVDKVIQHMELAA